MIAASMKVLHLNGRFNMSSNPLFPDDVKSLTKSDKLKLLLDISAKVVDQFIFDHNFARQMVDGIVLQQEKENALNQQQTSSGRFPCRLKGCEKWFKYNGKSRKNHEVSHVPPVDIPDEACKLSPNKPNLHQPATNKDDLYN